MISVFDGFGWMCDGFFRILLDPGGFCWIFLEGFFGFFKKKKDSVGSLKDSFGF